MLDGFPRTIREAVGADRATRDAGGATDAVVFLDLPRSELIRRLENRATESGRVDDRHETIVRNRMREYETRTAPLRDYYQRRGVLVLVDAAAPVDEVTRRIFAALDASTAAS